jgi:hypothetical protein
MGKHTDLTGQMTDSLKRRITQYQHSYTTTLLVSDPKNKDAAILTDVRWRADQAVRWAARRGYTVEYSVVATPKEPCKYNCKGCRKRKSGDYYWVSVKLEDKEKDSYNHSWTDNLAKVCSKECGEMMILRLM